jgi:hypothetical protein
MKIRQDPKAEGCQMQVDEGHASGKGGYRVGNLLFESGVRVLAPLPLDQCMDVALKSRAETSPGLGTGRQRLFHR